MLSSRAEKHGHDLPRMLVSIVSDEIKNTYTRKSNRTSLSISKSKERGAALPLGTSNEVRRLADELFKAQKDMQTIRKETKKKKQPHREEQEPGGCLNRLGVGKRRKRARGCKQPAATRRCGGATGRHCSDACPTTPARRRVAVKRRRMLHTVICCV